MPSGGGLLQLVAQGKQDIYLTGNPQMTFFKLVYRRHTNYAIESQPMYFDGTPGFGQRISCVVPRRGDLLGQVYLQVNLPAIKDMCGNPISYVNSIGHALIEEVSLEIGSDEIDRQTGEWMEIYSQFVTPVGQQQALNNMIGRVDGVNTYPGLTGAQSLIVPLRFWFCNNPGNYLPLIALQYHPVRINVKLRGLQDLYYTGNINGYNPTTFQVQPVTPGENPSFLLYGDYVYLDTEESRRFVSNSHEYLIEQIQYSPLLSFPQSGNYLNCRLEFNNPIRELIWYIQRDVMTTRHEYFNYTTVSNLDPTLFPSQDMLASAIIQVDGQDRFEERNAKYFRLVQPWAHHTNTPIGLFLYNYSFALRPEEAQPSGSLNASRINSLVINMTLDNTTAVTRGPVHTRVYAVNHNILRIIDGYGGVLFKV
jgi:Major capsid protein N-terminus/Large eukaryotic DNA virus major capsid protein